MTARRAMGRFALILLAAALVLGASSVTGKPITDIRMIQGKWRGQISFTGGPYEIYYLTINPDSSLAASWGITTRHGKVSLEGARTRFTLYIWSGDLQYFAAGDRRVLILKEDFGTFDAQLTPAP